jgi:hypothetical protein
MYLAPCRDIRVKLRKIETGTGEWQAAIESLMLVAEFGKPTMFARIGVMRALNRHAEGVFEPSRKEKHDLGTQRDVEVR